MCYIEVILGFFPKWVTGSNNESAEQGLLQGRRGKSVVMKRIGMKTSGYNELPEVRKVLNIPEKVYLVDSTIRSLQSGVSGGRFTVRDLVEIGKALDGLGVKELIINLSWKNGLEVVRGLAQENLKSKIVGTFWAWDPSWTKWTEEGIKAGVDEICFESAPDGQSLRKAADIVRNNRKTVSHAFGKIYSYQQVVDLCREGVKCECQSQSFHDGFFRFAVTPEAVQYLIKSIKKDVKRCPPLYVHFSNFFGQATMTSAAAIVAGATAVDVCMNGIGHHCGHTSLAEIALVLEVLYGVRTGIRLEKLKEVSRLVQKKSNIPVPFTAPIMGDFSFIIDGAFWATEAHLPYARRLLAKSPFPPDLVGTKDRIIWSDKTATPESLRVKLASMNLRFDEQDVKRVLVELKKVLHEKKEYPNWISDSELRRLCKEILSGKRSRECEIL